MCQVRPEGALPWVILAPRAPDRPLVGSVLPVLIRRAASRHRSLARAGRGASCPSSTTSKAPSSLNSMTAQPRPGNDHLTHRA